MGESMTNEEKLMRGCLIIVSAGAAGILILFGVIGVLAWAMREFN
jgi:hypothetical protein